MFYSLLTLKIRDRELLIYYVYQVYIQVISENNSLLDKYEETVIIIVHYVEGKTAGCVIWIVEYSEIYKQCD